MSRLTFKFTLIDDETDEPIEHQLPGRRIVCERCHGEGQHVNPVIDGHGLSAEDFEEDPDFREDYLRGVYDIPCAACGGRRVVDVLDEEAALTSHPELLRRYYEDLERRAEWARDDASEARLRMMEAGERW